MLYVVPNTWLKILGMFIIPILQLSAGTFLLICIASLASKNLLPVLVYGYKLRDVGFRVVVGCAML